nr:DUF4260 family protein [uncultured Eudoraea sp.]
MLRAYFSLSLLEGIRIISFSHSSMDRAFEYDLKYEKGFKYTYLV